MSQCIVEILTSCSPTSPFPQLPLPSLCPTPPLPSLCPTPPVPSLCPTPPLPSLCPTPPLPSLCPTPPLSLHYALPLLSLPSHSDEACQLSPFRDLDSVPSSSTEHPVEVQEYMAYELFKAMYWTCIRCLEGAMLYI